MINKVLKRRIIDITYKHKLSHLSSCLNAVDTVYDIYKDKLPEDKFVLSCGHAGLALYVVLEELSEGIVDACDLLRVCGIHPDRMVAGNYIDCSTGSLGQGLPIAVGLALADPKHTVYCVISDGECAEGSIWESLTLIEELGIGNIKVYAILNGQSAYKQMDSTKLSAKLRLFYPDINIVVRDLSEYPELNNMGLLQHYRVLSDDEYRVLMEFLK